MSSYEEGPSTGPAAADADPFPNLRGHRRRGLRVTTAAAVALGLAVGGGAVANAAGTGSTPSTSAPGAPFGHDGMHGTPPAAVGTVASVGTNTFTLTGRDGTTVTVDVGSTTTYREVGVTSATIADVKVGSHVAVFGTESGSTVTATSVGIGMPGGPGGPGGPGDGDGDGPMGPAPSTGTGSSSTNAGVGSTSTSGSSVTA